MKSFFRLRREIGHGGTAPRGYGMAWYEPRQRLGVYFPAPLHWVARALRELSYRLRTMWQAPARERFEVFQMQRLLHERQCLAEEYARGYMTGWRECFSACLEVVEEEIAHADEAWEVGKLLSCPPKPPQKN